MGPWHVAAILAMLLMAAVNLRGWLTQDLIPPGDFAGYLAQVEYVRDALLDQGRVPVWSTKWFAGSTTMMSSFKEYATFPLALAFGPLLGVKLMFLLAKVVAALGMYLIFVRLFGSPLAGLLAGYAYAFCNRANYPVQHLDLAISYALFPFAFLASVEMLRQRRWEWAAALGVLGGCLFSNNYLQATLLPILLALLLLLRPWRGGAGPEKTCDAPQRASGWLTLFCVALAAALLFGGSQLAWFAFDAEHHALLPPEDVAAGVRRYIVHSPFLFLNRGDWMRPWLDAHQPPEMAGLLGYRYWSASYLGAVVMLGSGAGWVLARRQPRLRRWYQSFLLLFLFQYWMAMGKAPLVWLIARSFGWPESLDATLRWGLTASSLACLSCALALLLRRRGHGAAPLLSFRVELLLGLSLLFAFSSQPLFGGVRELLPLLNQLRAPGHFFDLAPFSLAGVFGVALVAGERALRRSGRPGRAYAVGAVVALLLVLDFAPSTRSFYQGTPAAPVRAFEDQLAALPGADGTLRIALLASTDASRWRLNTLVGARSEAGMAWSWLGWQAGKYWPPYLMAATPPRAAAVMAANPPRAGGGEAPFEDAARDALSAIARLRYLLHPAWDAQRSPGPPWELWASNEQFALWQRPPVMPMAYAYRSYLLSVGAPPSEDLAIVPPAFHRNLLLVSGGERLSQSPAGLVAEAAGVICHGEAALADAASRALAEASSDTVLCGQPLGSKRARLSDLLERTPAEAFVTVGYQRPAPEHIRLTLDAGARPAVVFVSESYHPWWRARVSGVDDANGTGGAGARPVELLRAQVSFMAVRVGPGQHVVDLRLRRPLLVAAADFATGAAWLALALGTPLGALLRGLRR